MGFLDKAKKMAEQAQAKLDEAQKQFNEGQSGSAGSQPPPVEYDQHGRPIRAEAPPEPAAPDRTPPHGDPLQDQEQPPPPTMSTEPANEDDPYAPPKLTGGDPLM
jgi:hypothetical protein